MPKNILQVFTDNPASSMQSTDLSYLGRSPYNSSDDFAITWSNVMGSITTVGTIATGTWNATIISPTYGGTGVNNGGSTFTTGGNVTFSGAHTFTGTLTGNTSVTFPTSGTLATTASIPTFPVSLTNGGTNASLTASNGGIFYSTASAGAILSATATANQIVLSGSNAAPTWSSATYPTTTVANQILYSNATNTITGLSTGNDGILATDSGGVPLITRTLPSGVQVNITSTGTISSGTWNGSVIGGTYGGTGVNNGASTITTGGNITFSGAHTFTGTLTGNTSVTFPTSGTLATTSQTGILPFNNITTSITMSPNNVYFCSLLGSVTLTLPTTCVAGSIFQIISSAIGSLFTVAQNAGQSIVSYIGGTTVGVTGGINGNNNTVITLMCVVDDTTWIPLSVTGSCDVF